MKQTTVTIKYDEEKLNAVKQYMKKKDADFDAEMQDVLGKLYERYVPQAVREYIESRGEAPAAISGRSVKTTPKNSTEQAVKAED